MTKTRNFSPEFRLEAAQLVVDQGYTVKAACDAMGVSKSTMEYRVRRLRAERSGKAPQKGEALTPEQREIQDLKRKPYWGNHFWAKGYCVDTVGVDADRTHCRPHLASPP